MSDWTLAPARWLVFASCAVATLVYCIPAAAEVPTHTNAHVVSVNVQMRTLVLKMPDGTRRTVELADHVAGMGDIEAGDEVVLSLREEPSRPRVNWISKSVANTRTSLGSSKVTAAFGGMREPVSLVDVDFFDNQVAALAEEADAVDRLWGQFQATCSATSNVRYEGGRQWVSLWDGEVKADMSSGFCRDLYNQIINRGTVINEGMKAAEDIARKTLAPGTMREIERRHAMDWNGWGQPRPPLQTP